MVTARTPPLASRAGLRRAINDRLPARYRRRLIDARLRARRTRGDRTLPDFLVIGAQRSGTSSLYKWLEAHPGIHSSVRKETNYFAHRYDRGEAWYRSHFPTEASRTMAARAHLPFACFEASPYYLFHPAAPERVAALVPGAKLVVLLRDPVERAISHYRHMRRFGQEPLSLEDALRAEDERLAGVEATLFTPGSASLAHERWSYAARGRYAEQLSRWWLNLPRAATLVLASEALYRDPEATTAAVVSHVGLRPAPLASYANASAEHTESLDVSERVRRELTAYFAPHNEALYSLLGVDFGWPR